MFHFFFINIGAIWNIRSEKAGDASSLQTQRDSCRGKRKQKRAEQKIGKNLCLPRYNEGIGIGGVFKGYLQ